jgi:hypothetical protein
MRGDISTMRRGGGCITSVIIGHGDGTIRPAIGGPISWYWAAARSSARRFRVPALS